MFLIFSEYLGVYKCSKFLVIVGQRRNAQQFINLRAHHCIQIPQTFHPNLSAVLGRLMGQAFLSS